MIKLSKKKSIRTTTKSVKNKFCKAPITKLNQQFKAISHNESGMSNKS